MNNSKIPFDIRELSNSKAINFYNLLNSSIPNEIRPGQIWSTHSSFRLPDGQIFETDEPKLVIIIEGEGKPTRKFDSISVTPLSNHTSMASEYDLVIKQESGSTPLAFDFMIELWNETPALKGQLNRFICSVSEFTLENILQLYSSRLTNTKIPENVKKYIGMKIIAEDDPRRLFQEEEIVAATYLANAATAALDADFEEQFIENTETKNLFVFEAKPFLGKLSDFAGGLSTKLVVAHAANNVNTEAESWLIVQSKDTENFVFELLYKRLPPYSIYLQSHVIAPDIIGHNCIVSIKTKAHLFRSFPTTLKEGIKINVGNDSLFLPEDIEVVKLEIETS